MDFGEKIVANLRVGFREAKNETRREKRAKSVFRASTKAIEESKIAAKIFPSFCENHPIFGVANSAY